MFFTLHTYSIRSTLTQDNYQQTTPTGNAPTAAHSGTLPHATQSQGQTLSDCAESLAETSDEIAKLTRFFGAISCLAQHIVHSHVRSFTDAVSAVINHENGDAPTKKQQQVMY